MYNSIVNNITNNYPILQEGVVYFCYFFCFLFEIIIKVLFVKFSLKTRLLYSPIKLNSKKKDKLLYLKTE